MNTGWRIVTTVVCAIVTARTPLSAGPAKQSPAFDIPRIESITIDGKSDDWRDSGFRVDVLADNLKSRPIDYDCAFRVAWNKQGLIIIASVRDGTPIEQARVEDLWERDAVEIFVSDLSDPRSRRYRLMASAGRTQEFAELRQHYVDQRDVPGLPDLSSDVAAARADDGYTIEALLPWSNLGIEPKPGSELGLQIIINNAFGPYQHVRSAWFPSIKSLMNPADVRRIRLSDVASSPVRAAAWAEYENGRRLRVTLWAVGRKDAKPVEVVESFGLPQQRTLAQTTLANAQLTDESERTRLVSHVSLPMPPPGQAYLPLTILLDGQVLATITVPDAAVYRRQAMAEQELLFRPFVFGTEYFPACEFEHPTQVEDLIGSYTISTSFYDKDYQPMRKASSPGRYGAVVEIKSEHGQTYTRFMSLYRQPGQVNWEEAKHLTALPQLAADLGIDPAVTHKSLSELEEFVQYAFGDALNRNAYSAMLFAALHERSRGEPMLQRNRPWQKNNDWLYGLKKATGNAVPLQHLVHLPPQYDTDAGKSWPAILFLHGAGERGDDVGHLWTYGILKRIRQGANLPFIVISPQCPKNESWAPQQVIDLLDHVVSQYRVDPDRIYLTGLSMGGSGTWATGARFPNRFAAIVPICGHGDPLEAERLKDLPVWAFHGAKDDVVPLSASQDSVHALRKIGGRVRFTVYPEAKHDSFTQAYATDELYTWLLHQRRGHPAEPPATLPAE